MNKRIFYLALFKKLLLYDLILDTKTKCIAKFFSSLFPSKCGTMGHLLAVAPLTSVFRNDTTCSRHPPVTDSQGEEQQWRAGSSDTVSEDVLILIL